MSAKSEMQAARAELILALDAKLGDMPEWKAFRAIERGIAALSGPANGQNASSILQKLSMTPVYRNKLSYGDLAFKALSDSPMPLTTIEVIDIIENSKGEKFEDAEKAKINIASSLSRDVRIKSVPWRNGKAWWPAEKEIPSETDVFRGF